MDRAIFLAGLGLGKTKSNPLVGAVLVKDNKIIGEGYHREFGKAHAEVEALKGLTKEECEGAILFVTLEPCNHFGKTPPCTHLILEKGIKKVFIGSLDPHPLVSGSGIEYLRNNGVVCEVGMMEKECRAINKRFFCAIEKKRPYIVLKWAQSLNGILGTGNPEEPLKGKISNEWSKLYTHRWRSEEQAILVGCNTLLNDNPLLNLRFGQGNHPVILILDPNGRIKSTRYQVFKNKKKDDIIIFTQNKNPEIPEEFQKIIPKENYHLKYILEELINSGIHSVLVEGGPATHQFFIDENYWDEIRFFESNEILQGKVKSPEIKNAVFIHSEKIADNTYYQLLPKA